MKGLILAICLVVIISVHIWSVVLSIQVNGFFSIWGFIAASATLAMPFLAEAGWGFWAFQHGHPYLWGAIAFFACLGLGSIASSASKK